MIISNNVTRKLLIAGLALAIISPFSLDAMKRKQPSISSSENSCPEAEQPVSPEHEIFFIKQAASSSLNDNSLFPVELVQYIYRFNWYSTQNDCQNKLVDIIQNCDDPNKLAEDLVKAIDQICAMFTPDESVKIVTTALIKACKELSIPFPFDKEDKPMTLTAIEIKKFTMLEKAYALASHNAVKSVNKKVVTTLLSAANAINDGSPAIIIRQANWIIIANWDQSCFDNEEIAEILEKYEIKPINFPARLLPLF